jgi:hypothetical protein
LPSLVRADGTYRLLRDGDFDVSAPRIANYSARNVKVQWSHWNQLLALPLMNGPPVQSLEPRSLLAFP